VRLRHALISAGESKRLKLQGLKPERLEVIAGGVAILSAVFESLGITEMRPARGALRLGVLYDLLGRREDRDLRVSSAEQLQERFAVDHDQAHRVARLALNFYQTLDPHALEEQIKRLNWAAQWHEVGFTISHSDYHKHGAYLVQHSELPGFSRSDQERIAELVLAQRGNLKKVAALLSQRETATKFLALRLAVIFAHARRRLDLPNWRLAFGRTIEFALDADWLSRHPLTHYLLEEEAKHWERVGVPFAVRSL
jgi:exopolyphosphatase/guanosine-5'-triphosphate,3'-diphosphate pyrophosphatase